MVDGQKNDVVLDTACGKMKAWLCWSKSLIRYTQTLLRVLSREQRPTGRLHIDRRSPREDFSAFPWPLRLLKIPRRKRSAWVQGNEFLALYIKQIITTLYEIYHLVLPNRISAAGHLATAFSKAKIAEISRLKQGHENQTWKKKKNGLPGLKDVLAR